MKLFFHIGAEKTGTTSLQSWCAANRAVLQTQGIWYSKVLGPVTHRRICLWALDETSTDDGFRNQGLTTPEARAAFRERLPTEFADEVAAARDAGARVFMISSEHCQSRLRSPTEVARTRAFLTPHFDEIEIFLCLRPQIDAAVSLASTISRDRFRLRPRFFAKVTPENPYYDYAGLMERWQAAYGTAALTLHPFKRNPDTVAAVAERLGIDRTGFKAPARENRALDIRTIAMLNAVRVPLFEAGERNPFGALFLDELPVQDRLEIGRAWAQTIQARFVKGNARVAAGQGGIVAADLEPDWERYAETSNLGLLEANCAFAPQIEALVRVFNERLRLQICLLRITEAERAVARGNAGPARGFITRAETEAAALESAMHFSGDIAWARRRLATVTEAVERLETEKTRQ